MVDYLVCVCLTHMTGALVCVENFSEYRYIFAKVSLWTCADNLKLTYNRGRYINVVTACLAGSLGYWLLVQQQPVPLGGVFIDPPACSISSSSTVTDREVLHAYFWTSQLAKCWLHHVYSVRQKKSSEVFFAIFWKTTWNFKAKFYTLINCLYTRNSDKRHDIIFN